MSLVLLPSELLESICQLVYLSAIPASAYGALDPYALPPSNSLPTNYQHQQPSRPSTESYFSVQSVLSRLCLVNKALYATARPLLFRRIKITLPYSFLLLLRTLGASHLASAYDAFHQTGAVNLDPRDPGSFVSMVAAAGFAHATGGKLVVSLPSSSSTSANNSSGKHTESPYRSPSRSSASRTRASDSVSSATGSNWTPEASQFRGKLVTDAEGEVELVWQEAELLSETASSSEEDAEEMDTDTDSAMAAGSGAMTNLERDQYGVPKRRRQVQQYLVTLRQDASVADIHRWVRILDFSTFRTQGMRRTIGQGDLVRFVTPARLLALITACSDGLVAFGASETMDSALTKDVLEALLFRRGQTAGPGSGGGAQTQVGDERGDDEEGLRRSRSRSRRPLSRGRDSTFVGGARERSTLRGVSIERRRAPDSSSSEEDELSSRRSGGIGNKKKFTHKAHKKELQSLDLCNCVSRRFEQGLTEFVEAHLRPVNPRRATDTLDEEEDDEDTERESDEEDGAGEQRRGRERGRSRREQQQQQQTASSSSLQQQPAASGSALRTASISRSLGRSASRTRNFSSSRSRAPSILPNKPTQFPSVQRLGLSGITIGVDILAPFLLAFPRLTHLDLSRSRIDAATLQQLGANSSQMSLHSLSLAHCRRLTSESIAELLCDSGITVQLRELSLESDLLFLSPLTSDDMTRIVRRAPCFRSGRLRYLDLGGCPVTDAHLTEDFASQPALLDLGLGAIQGISLGAVSTFLRQRAANVQILSLAHSCQLANGRRLGAERDGVGGAMGLSASELNKWLLAPCAETPELPLTVQLALMGFAHAAGGMSAEEARAYRTPRPPTNLRVVELSDVSLAAFGGALRGWQVVRGQGRRGWIVDTNAAPDPHATEFEPDPLSYEKEWSASGRYRSLARIPAVRRARSTGASTHSLSPARVAFDSRIGRGSGGDAGSSAATAAARSSSHHRASVLTPTSAGMARNSSLRDYDASTTTGASLALAANETEPVAPREDVVRNMAEDHPRVMALREWARAKGHVPGDVGWHSKKMEILMGFGMLGREAGAYAHVAYQV